MTHKFFSVYEDCASYFSKMRGVDVKVFIGCCVVCSFNDGEFTLRGSGKRICSLAGVGSIPRDVSLGRLVGMGMLLRVRRGVYVVNPYVCYKGNYRKALMDKYSFVDLGGVREEIMAPSEEYA